MTVGVYGLVGGIVKLDEFELWLTHGVPALHHWIENVTAHTAEAIGGVSLDGKLWRSARA
jgi:predicted DNA repair protein MutK